MGHYKPVISGDGKSHDHLNPLDLKLKRAFPYGMRSSTDVEIHLKCGFELFNTRPYHNYETWSSGYYAIKDGKVIASAEDLDILVDRIVAWKEKQKDVSDLCLPDGDHTL